MSGFIKVETENTGKKNNNKKTNNKKPVASN